jgi:hypothetical protein
VPATTWYKYKSTSDQDSTRDFRLARNPDRFCGPSSFTTAYVCSSFSPACDRRTFPLSPLHNCFSTHSGRCPAADQPTYTSYTSTRSLAFVAATLTGCGRCAPAHSAHHTAKFFSLFFFCPYKWQQPLHTARACSVSCRERLSCDSTAAQPSPFRLYSRRRRLRSRLATCRATQLCPQRPNPALLQRLLHLSTRSSIRKRFNDASPLRRSPTKGTGQNFSENVCSWGSTWITLVGR